MIQEVTRAEYPRANFGRQVSVSGTGVNGLGSPGTWLCEPLADATRLPVGIATGKVPATTEGILRSTSLVSRIESRLSRGAALALCLAIAAAAADPSVAAAQPMDPAPQRIEASPKGLLGLGLVGAELGLTVPALAGLDDAWALIVFPVVGAAGGAVAGHFAIDNRGNEKAAVATLTLGLALVVPSVVLTLWATRYDPDDEAAIESTTTTDGEGAAEEGPADTAPSEETAAARRATLARAGTGLLRFGEGGLQVGLPGVSVLPSYSVEELALFGGSQRNEVRLSLFSGSF